MMQRPPLTRNLRPRADHVDRSLILDNYSLSMFVVRFIFTEPEHPETGERVSNTVIAVTPGGPKLVYQFAAMAQTIPDRRPNRAEELESVLGQDKTALEAVQKLFDRLGPERCPEFSVKRT